MPVAQENTRKYYADNRELAEDIAAGYKKFIADVYAAGCRDLQFDDCSWGMLVDPLACTLFDTDEKGLKAIKEQLLELNNTVIAGKPDDLVINTHVCRGNFHSTYASSGAYDGVAQTLLARENVGAYYLEFDDARSGGFAPLTAVSGDKKVVLGLVTTKRAARGQGRRDRPHPRSGKVPAARQTVPQPAVRLRQLRDRQQSDRSGAVGKARAGQGDRRGSLGLRPRISKSFLKKPLRSYPQRLFPCCFLFDMFPDKAIPLPLRSGLQHFQQQLLRFLFFESINIPTQAGKAARIKYPAAHLEPPELARNGLCSDMVRVVGLEPTSESTGT